MDRRFRRVGIALLAFAALAVVLLVVLGVIGPTRWPDGALFVPRDAATLQEAVDRAFPDTTIVLFGQDEAFLGPVVIDTPGLNIVSAKGRARLAAAGAEAAVTLRADGVAIRGVDITAAGVGIRIESTQCVVEDVRIVDTPVGIQLDRARECSLDEVELRGGRIGLELVSSGGNAVTDLVVRGATVSGVRAIGSWDNTLERCIVSDAPTGVSFEQGSTSNELRGCLISGASTAGVVFRGSNDNLLVDSVVRDARIGVALDGVTGNEIAGCEIDGAAIAGLSFVQSVQNRATRSAIGASQGDGISLSQSAENALTYNRIDGCAGAGIRLDESDRNLVLANRLTDNGTGILSNGSSRGRILRNEIAAADPSSACVLVTGGTENRFFDNRVRGGELGFLLGTSEGTVLLRNEIEGQAAAVALSQAPATYVAENRIAGARVGIVVLDSSRAELVDNVVEKNDVGAALLRAGPGVRIEGNAFRGNRIGLLQTDAPSVAGIERLAVEGGEVVAPIVANNVFAWSGELDVMNETSVPVLVAGNWWGEAAGDRDPSAAGVSGDVDLEASAWRGTVAIGTQAEVSQEVLGRILQLALGEAGFRVIDLIGMGDSDRLREALQARDVDFIWWGTSETILVEGEVVVTSIPTTRRWTAVVSEATANSLPERTLSAFAAAIRESGRRLRLSAVHPSGDVAVSSFVETYGLSESSGPVSWAGNLGEAEALLKFGAVDAAIVDGLEEVLTLSGFVALDDDLEAFEPVSVVIACYAGLLARFPGIEDTLSRLTERLTTSAIHDLVSRVRLLQRAAQEVAREYLVQQGLLAE